MVRAPRGHEAPGDLPPAARIQATDIYAAALVCVEKRFPLYSWEGPGGEKWRAVIAGKLTGRVRRVLDSRSGAERSPSTSPALQQRELATLCEDYLPEAILECVKAESQVLQELVHYLVSRSLGNKRGFQGDTGSPEEERWGQARYRAWERLEGGQKVLRKWCSGHPDEPREQAPKGFLRYLQTAVSNAVTDQLRLKSPMEKNLAFAAPIVDTRPGETRTGTGHVLRAPTRWSNPEKRMTRAERIEARKRALVRLRDFAASKPENVNCRTALQYIEWLMEDPDRKEPLQKAFAEQAHINEGTVAARLWRFRKLYEKNQSLSRIHTLYTTS